MHPTFSSTIGFHRVFLKDMPKLFFLGLAFFPKRVVGGDSYPREMLMLIRKTM